MYGKLREDIREIIRKLCGYKGIEIVEGNVSVDHVHLCVKIPPKLSVSIFMGYLKGKSALITNHPLNGWFVIFEPVGVRSKRMIGKQSWTIV